MSRHHELIKNDPRWKAARADCLIRDGHACIECGASEELHADHKQRLEDGGAPFDLDNLQTLCRPCHEEKERQYTANRLIRNTWLNEKYSELQTIIDGNETENTAPVF